MCEANKSFEELIEEEDDPKQLLENFKSKIIKYVLLFLCNSILSY